MVVSCRRVEHKDEEKRLATVEYYDDSGHAYRIRWLTESEPTIGQSVLMKPKEDGSGEKEVVECDDKVGGATFRIVVGGALVLAASLIISS